MLAQVKVLRYITETANVYRFEELPEEVQEKLVEKSQNKEDAFFWDFFEDEIRLSWEAIADLMGCNLDYSYSLCSYSYTKLAGREYEDFWELSGVRAMAYIWNNWIEPNLQGKYLGHKKNTSEFTPIYSKLTRLFNCPFTGCIWDGVLITAWTLFKFDLQHGHKKLTVADFKEMLEQEMTSQVMQEAEYRTSKEYHRERLASGDEWYFADGSAADVQSIDAA